MKVKDLMSRKVETLEQYDTLSLSEDLMKMKRLRHLPIVEDGRLVGIVSQRDLFRAGLSTVQGFGSRAQEGYLKTVLVKEVITNEVITIGPDEDIGKAARIMLKEEIGCLPVVEGEKLVGLISESDIMRFIAES
jgi:CBS domain-containing protein